MADRDRNKGHSTMKPVFALAITTLLCVAASAKAQKGGDDTSSASAIEACQSILDRTERLACYDRSVGEFAAARARGRIVVTDSEQSDRKRRAIFGLFGTEARSRVGVEEPVQQITSTVSDVSRLPNDHVRLKLADGSVWDSVDTVLLPPRSGTAITVKAGLFGSFLATPAKGRPTRVRRIY